MPYSKLTSKGQLTIPAQSRRKYGLDEGTVVIIEDTDEGLLLKRAADIIDSAGKLAALADADDVIKDLIRSRRAAFR
jgi:AbrB family looped-hinge helix DNA binding protein